MKSHILAKESKFILGHELTHLKCNHTFKKIGTIVLGPWALRAGLIVGNTIIQRAFSSFMAINKLEQSKFMKGLASTTNFLFLNEIMGQIYSFSFA